MLGRAATPAGEDAAMAAVAMHDAVSNKTMNRFFISILILKPACPPMP
jgi:hypothetical protein